MITVHEFLITPGIDIRNYRWIGSVEGKIRQDILVDVLHIFPVDNPLTDKPGHSQHGVGNPIALRILFQYPGQ